MREFLAVPFLLMVKVSTWLYAVIAGRDVMIALSLHEHEQDDYDDDEKFEL